MKEPTRVTLADIAERAGCDKSTVSLALRGHPRIPAATADRVRRAAKALGYRPDPALARLSALRWKGREGIPAVSVALVARGRRDYPVMREKIAAAAERWVRGAGYGFERIFLEDYPNGQAAARVLKARGVAGLIAMASAQEDGLDGFAWEKWPVAQVLEGAGNIARVCVARSDEFGNLMDAGRRVLAAKPESAAVCLLGQRRASGSDEHLWAAAWSVTQGWRQAGIACGEPRVFPSDSRKQDEGLRAMAGWLAETRPAAAVVANSAVDGWLRAAGARPGREMDLIALRLLDEPGWAGYVRDHDAISEAAARRVDWMIRHGRRGPEVVPELVLVPDRWQDGRSFDV